MAALLGERARRAEQSTSFPYFNGLRAERHAAMLEGVPYSVPIDRRLKYARELLQAGRNEDCIVELERVLQEAFSGQPVNRANRRYYEVLALAYLRLGEQNNCIQRRDPASCIVPVKGGGIHSLKRGSEKAAELYEALLRYDSTDLMSRWMLNLAHMTLGTYPQGVPEAFRIPPEAFESEGPLQQFHDRGAELGVDVLNHAGGSALEDFDNDGWLDIFTTSYSLRDEAKFFRNRQGRRFQDRSHSAGLKGLVAGLNFEVTDFDNDGWKDLYITRGAWLAANGQLPNSLLRNNGDGTFTDVTRAAGLLDFYPSQTAAWADYDLDGWLDLFVGNESTPGFTAPCRLFHNNGDGTFTDLAPQLGLDVIGFVKGVAWGDVNNDGLPDLFLSIYNSPNKLFLNRGPKGASWRFEEAAAAAGVQEPLHSFPVWFWDYDNDGWEDLFVSGYYYNEPEKVVMDVTADYLGLPFDAETPRLYHNNGDGTFSDRTRQARLDRALFTMGCNFGDFDNDGWLDFYLGTGELNMWAVIPNRAFRNAEGRFFQDVTTAGGFGMVQKGHGVAFGDYDQDGDQDIYHQVGGAVEGDVYANLLLENPGNDNAWVVLELEGTRSNRPAIGARVALFLRTLDGRSRTLHRTVSTGSSFGCNSLQLEIGLGNALAIDSVRIAWPNTQRARQTFTDLQLRRKYRLVEGARKPLEVPYGRK